MADAAPAQSFDQQPVVPAASKPEAIRLTESDAQFIGSFAVENRDEALAFVVSMHKQKRVLAGPLSGDECTVLRDTPDADKMSLYREFVDERAHQARVIMSSERKRDEAAENATVKSSIPRVDDRGVKISDKTSGFLSPGSEIVYGPGGQVVAVKDQQSSLQVVGGLVTQLGEAYYFGASGVAALQQAKAAKVEANAAASGALAPQEAVVYGDNATVAFRGGYANGGSQVTQNISGNGVTAITQTGRGYLKTGIIAPFGIVAAGQGATVASGTGATAVGAGGIGVGAGGSYQALKGQFNGPVTLAGAYAQAAGPQGATGNSKAGDIYQASGYGQINRDSNTSGSTVNGGTLAKVSPNGVLNYGTLTSTGQSSVTGAAGNIASGQSIAGQQVSGQTSTGAALSGGSVLSGAYSTTKGANLGTTDTGVFGTNGSSSPLTILPGF